MITLYTRTVCPKCMLVKQTLDGAGIKYDAKNLDFDEEAEAELRGQGIMALPTAKHNGEYHVDVQPILALVAKLSN